VNFLSVPEVESTQPLASGVTAVAESS